MVVTGSYGRYEAHEESDLDYFALYDQSASIIAVDQFADRMKDIVATVIGIAPGIDGPWGAATAVNGIDTEIGGNTESNFSFTRRALFLLEGRCVGPNDIFLRGRETLLNRYIGENISDHQLGLFLLNDVIRFYRTMCVDFEYKTVEQKKSWGLNNIKLVFSRKLLYFSGILVAAEMYQKTYSQKRDSTLTLLEMSPIDRIAKICGHSADNAFRLYNEFLGCLQDPVFREMAKAVSVERPHPDEFRKLKNASHHFSMALSQTLHSTYDGSHPIHRALLL